MVTREVDCKGGGGARTNEGFGWWCLVSVSSVAQRQEVLPSSVSVCGCSEHRPRGKVMSN